MHVYAAAYVRVPSQWATLPCLPPCTKRVCSGTVRCFGATAAGAVMEDMIVGTGGHFGERALLLGAPRAANVEANNDVTCYVLARKEFSELLGPLKNLLEQDLIARVLNTIPVFAVLSQADRDRVLARMTSMELSAGQVLLSAGQAVPGFYFVKSGELKVSRAGKDETMVRDVPPATMFCCAYLPPVVHAL